MATLSDFLSKVFSGSFPLSLFLFLIVGVMLSVAYLVYMERKVIAFMQLRHGPSVVGPFGLLQPIADALKLMTKDTVPMVYAAYAALSH